MISDIFQKMKDVVYPKNQFCGVIRVSKPKLILANPKQIGQSQIFRAYAVNSGQLDLQLFIKVYSLV